MFYVAAATSRTSATRSTAPPTGRSTPRSCSASRASPAAARCSTTSRRRRGPTRSSRSVGSSSRRPTTGYHHHRLINAGGVEPHGDVVTGRVPLFFNSDVVMGVVRPAESDAGGHVLPQRRSRRDALRPRGRAACSTRSSDRSATAPATTWCSRSARPGGWTPTPDSAAADALPRVRRRRSSRRSATATTTASCSSTRPYSQRDIRAAGRGPAARRGRRLRRSTSARAAGSRPTTTAPPVRRRRLGRLPLAVRLQHRRLRADHRPRPPAAAGPPDVPGAQLRRLLVRAAQVRLPPAGHPGAVQPLEHQLATRSSTTSPATS